MVVVTVIGILAAIGIPRVFACIRTSGTAEVAQDAALMASTINAYAQSQLKTTAELQVEIDATWVTPDKTGTKELSTIIPQTQIRATGLFCQSLVSRNKSWVRDVTSLINGSTPIMADISELSPTERAKHYRALASDARREAEAAQPDVRKSYRIIAEQFERLTLAVEAEILRDGH